MHKIIERYIYDVTRRLPEKERDEVGRELAASLSDMLPNQPREQDVADVLTKLGAPRILAEQYRQKPRYLISPAMFEIYVTVLKTVLPITAIFFACFGAVSVLSTGGFEHIFEEIVGSAIAGTLQALCWVTLGCAVADHVGVKLKPWSVSDLPPLPNQKGTEIKRIPTLVGLIFSVICTVLPVMMILNAKPFLLWGYYPKIITPFSQAALDRSIPYILLLGGVSMFAHAMKLYWARWNIPVYIATVVSNLVWVSVVIYMLHWTDFFNSEFVAFINKLTGNAYFLRYTGENVMILFFSVVFAVAAAIDIGVSTWYTAKGVRNSV